MNGFNIDCTSEQPDHLYVDIERRFHVAIERTDSGLSLL
jgi:hypothetical protein